MSQQEFDTYLSLLCKLLRIMPQQREQVADEFRAHMEDRLEELLAKGMTRDEAIRLALEEFGNAAGLAAQLVSISRNRRRKWVMRVSAASLIVASLLGLIVLALWPGQKAAPVLSRAVAQEASAPASQQSNAKKPPGGDEWIEEMLAKKVDLHFTDEPLKQVVAEIQKITGVPVIIHRKVLDEAAISLVLP